MCHPETEVKEPVDCASSKWRVYPTRSHAACWRRCAHQRGPRPLAGASQLFAVGAASLTSATGFAEKRYQVLQCVEYHAARSHRRIFWKQLRQSRLVDTAKEQWQALYLTKLRNCTEYLDRGITQSGGTLSGDTDAATS